MAKKTKTETMPEDSEEHLEDEAEYSRKSDFNKAELVQAQVNICLACRTEDMRPGYTTWITDKYGNAKPQVIPDSRKKFCASVEALKNLLAPEIEKDKKTCYMSNIEDFDGEKEALFVKYCYHERIGKDEKLGWIFTDRKKMPQIGETIMDVDPKFPKSRRLVGHPGGWDRQVNDFWDEMVVLHDTLFAELNILVHKNNYFKQSAGF